MAVIDEYVKKTLDLVRMERDSEIEEARRLQETLSDSEPTISKDGFEFFDMVGAESVGDSQEYHVIIPS